MALSTLSRREFARTTGAAVGAAFGAGWMDPAGAEASLPHDAPPDVIQLNSNENPHGPSPRALAAMTDSQRVSSRYPDAEETRLLAALARLHGVEPERIVLGCGSGEVLRMADMAFLGAGKKLVAAEPTFEAVFNYAKLTNAEAVKAPLAWDFRHDLPAMASACDGRTGLVYVCNPNNPTGTVVSRAELATFLDRVPASTTVLVDEAYHHFVEDPSYASATEWLESRPNLVVVRTFSKIYGMAGMRLGYAVGSKEAVQALRDHAVRDNGNAAVLAAARASLADGEHVARHRRLNSETRSWLCRELERDGRRFIPSQANFLMIDTGADVEPLIQAFRKRGILVGRRFPSMARWLRVSIGSGREMRAFLAELRALVPPPAGRSTSSGLECSGVEIVVKDYAAA